MDAQRLVLAVLLFVIGCGDDARKPTRDEQPEQRLLPSELGEAIYRAQCRRFAHCEDAWGPIFPSEERCLAYFAGDVLAFSLEDALYEVDESKARACLDKLENTSCSAFFYADLDRDCLGMFAGTLTQGACCDARGGCGPALYCPYDHDGTAACTPLAREDESCAARPCDTDLVCIGEVCVRTAGLNMSCASVPCTDGLWCDEASVCRAPKSLHDACSGSDPLECGVLACDVETGECSYRLVIGDACDSDDECPPGASCVGLSFPGTCVAMADDDGDACDPLHLDAPDCAFAFGYGLVCEAFECAPLPRRDEACDDEHPCFPFEDLFCQPSTQTCEERLPDGTLCEPDDGSGVDACQLGVSSCDPEVNQCQSFAPAAACPG